MQAEYGDLSLEPQHLGTAGESAVQGYVAPVGQCVQGQPGLHEIFVSEERNNNPFSKHLILFLEFALEMVCTCEGGVYSRVLDEKVLLEITSVRHHL